MLQQLNTVAKIGMEAGTLCKCMWDVATNKEVCLRLPRNLKSCCFIKFLHNYWCEADLHGSGVTNKNLKTRKRFGAQQDR